MSNYRVFCDSYVTAVYDYKDVIVACMDCPSKMPAENNGISIAKHAMEVGASCVDCSEHRIN